MLSSNHNRAHVGLMCSSDNCRCFCCFQFRTLQFENRLWHLYSVLRNHHNRNLGCDRACRCSCSWTCLRIVHVVQGRGSIERVFEEALDQNALNPCASALRQQDLGSIVTPLWRARTPLSVRPTNFNELFYMCLIIQTTSKLLPNLLPMELNLPHS